MKRRARLPVILAVAALAPAALAACGDEEVRYSDQKIIDKLDLEKSENGYSIGGDVFCEVKEKLFNDSDEADEALDKVQLGLVSARSEGSVGVEAIPLLSPEC